MSKLPLNTDLVFENTVHGTCWVQFCEAENKLALRLHAEPLGTLAYPPKRNVVHFLWPIREDNEFLGLYSAPIHEGEIQFEQAFCRFEVGLEFLSYDDTALLDAVNDLSQHESYTLEFMSVEQIEPLMESEL